MEFFVPSLAVFLVIAVAVVYLLPKLSPMILVAMASLLLAVGIYIHFQTFSSEYSESTLFSGLRSYGPGIMIGVIIVFLLMSIGMMFSKGTVPIPSMPTFASMPPANTATNKLTEGINNVLNNTSLLMNNKSRTVINNTSAAKNTPMRNLPVLL